MLSCLYRSSKPGAKSALEINPAACPVELEQLLNVKGTAALRPRGAQLLYERTDDAGAGAFTPPVLIYIKRLPLPSPCNEVVVKRTEVTHFVGRAQREARLQLQMDHPHLLPALASVRGKHHFYLLLPLAEGDLWAEAESLRAHGTGYMEDELREVAVQVLLGLEQLHKASLAHRDIKPANVLRLHDGRVAVADFGCADGATAGFVSAGTTQFQPPECRRKDPAARRMQVLPKGYDQRAQDMWSVGVTLACLWFAELPVVDRGGGGGTDRGGTDREGQPQTPKTQGQLQQQQQHSLQSSPQKPQQGEYGGQEGTREGERGAGEEGGGLSAEERRLEEQWQRWRKGGYCVGVEVEAEAEVLPGAVGEGEGGGGGGSGGGGGVRWQRWRTGGSHAEAEAGAGALGSVVMMHNGLAMEEGVGGAGEEGQEGGDGEGRPSATTGGCSYGRLGPGGGLYGGNLSAKSDTGMGLGTGGRLSNGCSGGGGGVGSGGGGGGGSGGGLGGLGDSNYSWTSCRSQFQEPQPNHLHQHHQQQQQLQQAGSLPNGQLPNGHRNAAGGPPGSSTGGGSNGTFPTVSAPPSGGGGDPSPAAASADPTALPPFLAAAGFRSLPTTVGACGLPMSPAFLDLLSGLLRPRHRDRLTCGQALEHTWVRCVLTDGGGGGGAGAGLQASQRDGEGNTVRLGGGGNTVGGRMGVPEPLSAAVRGRREAGGGEQGQGRGRGRAQQGGMRAVASASAFGSS